MRVSNAKLADTTPLTETAGGAWVERYLQPLLRTRFGSPMPPLRCLQLWAHDDDEASQLRGAGHSCVVLMPRESAYATMSWRREPVIGSCLPATPFADASFDFVFSSAFGRLARGEAERARLARELARIVRPGGAMLLSIGNRYCPVDLQDRSALLHGPFHPEKADLAQMERVFRSAGVTAIERLALVKHFRWARLPAPVRFLGSMMDRFLELASAPRRRWAYASPLNPMFMLWIRR